MTRLKKLRFAIVVGTLATLAACSTTSQDHLHPVEPPPAKDHTVEDALQLKDDGKVGDAAGVMVQVSERAANDVKAQYLFEAGQLYLAVPDAQHANDVLQKLVNINPTSGYTKVLKAQMYLVGGQTTDALSALGNAAPADINPASKGVYWRTLAEANEKCATTDATAAPTAAAAPATTPAPTGKAAAKPAMKKKASSMATCTQEAVHARAEANDALVAPAELSANQDALWQLMNAQTVANLTTMRAKATNPTMRAWLDLALLAKKTKGPVSEKAVNAWMKKYPDQVVLNQRLLELRGMHPEAMRHMAVILPTKSKELGRFAQAVWEGFQASQKNDADPYPIKLYDTDSNPATTLAAYRSALDHGAVLIVGPLSRSSLALLAQRRLLAVPTVALNVVEDGKFPINLYQFGLPIAQEARVVARGAKNKGFTDAIVLKGNTALDGRSSEAFINEWTQLHETVKVALSVQDIAGISQLAASATAPSPHTMVFVAADFQNALPAMKAMPDSWTVFGTSALNTDSADVSQLSKNQKIYFVDVPDLLGKSTTPAATADTSSNKPDAVYGRLYALGTDACRFSTMLVHDEVRYNRTLLNGDTGKLSVTRNGNVERDLPLLSLQHASLATYHADDLARLSPAHD
jgi:outer membrane PBP1 activator LpoA protein